MLSALRKLEAGIRRRWHSAPALVPAELTAESSEPRFGYSLGESRRLIDWVAERDPDVLAEFPAGGPYVFSPTASFRRRVQARVQAGCKVRGLQCKGTHGFRATFAERLLALEMAKGLSEREARKVVSAALGHNRVAVTLRYVPRGQVED